MSTINTEGIQSSVTLQDNMTSGFDSIIMAIDEMLGSINLVNSTPLTIDTSNINITGISSVQNEMQSLQNEMLNIVSTPLNPDVSVLTNGLNQASQVAANTNAAMEPLRNVMIEVDSSQLLALQQDAFEGQRVINQLEDQVGDLISENTRLQDQFNQSLTNAHKPARGLLDILKGIGSVWLSFRAIKGFSSLSSDMTDALSRVNLINDGSQTQDQLNKMINQMAKSTYSDYTSTLDLVTGLSISGGNTFGSNKEAISFAEQVNKHLTLSGASSQGKQSVMGQLPQILGKGKLQGQEFNTILANAPTIAQSLMDYLNADMAALRKMGTEGKLAGNILKNALLSAAEETNKKYDDMPVTMRDVMTNFATIFTTGLTPIYNGLRDLASNKDFQNMLYGAANAMAVMANIGFSAVSGLSKTFALFGNNLHIVIPVVGVLTAALIAAKSATIATTLATIKNNVVNLASATAMGAQTLAIGALNALKFAAATATALLTVATTGSTAAMWGLNTAMLANPIGVIIGGVVLLIGLFFGAVAAINKFTDANISMVGLVTGGFAFVGSVVANVFKILANTIILAVAAIWNPIAAVAEFVGNVFNDPVNTVKRLFVDMANSIIKVLAKIAGGMDFVFGTNLAGGLKDLQSELNNWSKNNVAKAEFKVPRMDPNELLFSTSNPFEDAKKGYEWGKDKNLGDLAGAAKDMLFNNNVLDNLGDIKKNTGKTADSLGLTNEEIKYLRDVAEQEVINRYTTATVNSNPTFNNNISNGMDLDTVVRTISDGLSNSVAAVAEGVPT